MGKYTIKLIDFWPEYISVILLGLAFLLSISTRSAPIAIFTTLCLGAVSARVFFVKRKEQPIAPFVLIISALTIGFISGMFFVNRLLISILFLLSFAFFYFLHDKKIIKTFKSKPFLK